MEIKWDAAALDDLEAVLRYIEDKFSLSDARLFYAEMLKQAGRMAVFPDMGKKESLLNGQFRSIPVNRLCKVVYTVMPDAIFIVALWSTRRDPEALRRELTDRVE